MEKFLSEIAVIEITQYIIPLYHMIVHYREKDDIL